MKLKESEEEDEDLDEEIDETDETEEVEKAETEESSENLASFWFKHSYASASPESPHAFRERSHDRPHNSES